MTIPCHRVFPYFSGGSGSENRMCPFVRRGSRCGNHSADPQNREVTHTLGRQFRQGSARLADSFKSLSGFVYRKYLSAAHLESVETKHFHPEKDFFYQRACSFWRLHHSYSKHHANFFEKRIFLFKKSAKKHLPAWNRSFFRKILFPICIIRKLCYFI